MSLFVTPLALSAAVAAGDDLVAHLVNALGAAGVSLANGDLVVVTSKVVAKSEGRVVAFSGTEADKIRLVESESRRVLRRRGSLLITETPHGFVNANAGVDLSNAEEGTAVLLPLDPDRSARRLRGEIGRRVGADVGVVITDTFGRAWRQGVCDVAIGSAGVRALLDLRGTFDANGRVLEATEVAIADEVAAAANLVMGKAASTPFALLRGLDASFFGEGSVGQDLVRRPHD
ncbi:MAG TPA: coenzyme F420-0:L-glutamate ligase, partial [Acidimicrobiales bacterium]|nr:coenzyme F420-0:L-glutamate ligase [Acidimicrobiales bacterium]